MPKKLAKKRKIVGVDLFCGAGGLTLGLRDAGISIVAGVDLDSACEYPFTANNGAEFLCQDVCDLTGSDLAKLYPKGSVRLLAGCAPCRPFSPLRRGLDNAADDEWGLLGEFGRIVRELKPELVTIENVADLATQSIFLRLVKRMNKLGYHVDWRTVGCPQFGIPQRRRRLVLVASLLGPVSVPRGGLRPEKFKTVRDAIGSLPQVKAGESHPSDPLHMARAMSQTNMERIQASRPGGTWFDWPQELRAPCHRMKTGETYVNVYARMGWEEPSPTITTLAYSFGSGRFGHPEQDRALTLRESAILQSFPSTYRFVRPGQPVYLKPTARLIGNAVPPKLAHAVGRALVRATL
jgi:DNA (cytosine-5)-methyltransferase 1